MLNIKNSRKFLPPSLTPLMKYLSKIPTKFQWVYRRIIVLLSKQLIHLKINGCFRSLIDRALVINVRINQSFKLRFLKTPHNQIQSSSPDQVYIIVKVKIPYIFHIQNNYLLLCVKHTNLEF